MALEIQKGRSKWWYGRITVNGSDVVKNLGVQIKGEPPASLREQGDAVFERSRAKAQAALEKLQLDLKARNTAEELVQTIHEIRTGARVSSITLEKAAERWKALPRRRPLSERYVFQADSWMKRFVTFLKQHHAAIKDMDQVQPAMARAYLAAEEKRGVSEKTYNNILIFLRSCFESLKEEAGIPKNPFAGIPTKEGETIFRKPFSEEELASIIEHAKADEFIYPVLITAMCTAMRRGDCCLLQRNAVDLPGRFIMVKTSKTGEIVQIPIFPILQAVLEKQPKTDSPYFFPEQATKYQLNPDNITLRVRKVLHAAGFTDAEGSDSEDGQTPSRGEIHQARARGLRKASIRDFHSFRVTWVTLALSAGVPLEIVQKVTGHRTAGIVMKHYFQPGREDFRRTLAGKMPSLLAGGPDKAPLAPIELRSLLEAMDSKSWRKIRKALLDRLPANEKAASPSPTAIEASSSLASA